MVNDEKLSFGYNFERICEEYDIKISEISKDTGISATTLYNIATRHTKKPRGNLVETIVEYMQTRVPELTMGDFLPSYDEETGTYSVEQLNKPDFIPIEFEVYTEDDELYGYLMMMGDILQRLTIDGKIEVIMRSKSLLKDPKYSKVV